ncbi:MAG: 5-methyltetrahydrofolate--homocysteine methyltransferase [Bacteroidetes bacterium]|nr:MAG: 5-methyltetrahydrofolate--homocysteine methyltransferase [Bacteroidota bacterium]
MKPVLDRINQGEILVCDGAMGSLLMDRAKEYWQGTCPEYINLSHPEIIEEIAGLYIRAGADIIETNTFGGSPLKLAGYSLHDKTEEINHAAIKAAKKASGNKAYIAASIGPSGKLLKPFGDTEPEEMYKSFYRQIDVSIDAGADMICIETMTDLNEALLAVEATRKISASIPVIVTMTYEYTSRGFFTIIGISIEMAIKKLENSGVDIIGSNCGNGIENLVLIAKEYKKHTRLPLIIQANAGIPELREGVPVYPETPEFMAKKCEELIQIGVSIIGGCCGTTPAHIHAIRNVVDLNNSQCPQLSRSSDR